MKNFKLCFKTVKYWARVVRMDDDHLTKKAYLLMLSIHNGGYKTWLSHIENILCKFGLEDFWINSSNLSPEQVYKKFKCVVYEDYVQKWYSCVSTYPKMRSYIMYKKSFNVESYLHNIKDFLLRTSLTQFRLSSHNLEIEMGRYNKPRCIPAHQRFCKLCNSGQVEDELHFLLYCHAYHELRTNFIQNINIVDNSVANNLTQDTMYKIMSDEDSKIQFLLCKYIKKCFDRRNYLLKVNIL